MNNPIKNELVSSLLNNLTIITQRNIRKRNSKVLNTVSISQKNSKTLKTLNTLNTLKSIKSLKSSNKQNSNNESGSSSGSSKSKSNGSKKKNDFSDDGEGCDDHNLLDIIPKDNNCKNPKYGSIHYVDACTFWKFPIWLIKRLDCAEEIKNSCNMHIQKFRRTILQQLKSAAIDLLMYATVRRDFLRTILLIELNNVAQLMEFSYRLELEESLKNKFSSLLPISVKVLDDQSKTYSDDLTKLADIMNEIYTEIMPHTSFHNQTSYTYNNVYCSFLVPNEVMQFTGMCCNGIVDNNWFALENCYKAMVMVTPNVYDDPRNIQIGLLRKQKFRIEAYFDNEEGRFHGFDSQLRMKLLKSRNNLILEHLVYSYFAANQQYVEEKDIFLMNGPETKGNIVFARIFHYLSKSAAI